MQNVCRDWMSSGYAGEIALRSHKGARARSRVAGIRTMASYASHRVSRAFSTGNSELVRCDRNWQTRSRTQTILDPVITKGHTSVGTEHAARY